MPALGNMSVGSLRGTRELEGTALCPFLARNWRKFDRLSLTTLMGQIRLRNAALRAVLEHGRQKRQWEEGAGGFRRRVEHYMVTDFILVEAAGSGIRRQPAGPTNSVR